VESDLVISLADHRWSALKGGRRILYDPRPALARLESGADVALAWRDLWDGLLHQGDVGDASYVSVPHLVAIQKKRAAVDWNTYALVAAIEVARTEPHNPPVPPWCESDYHDSISELARVGTTEIGKASDKQAVISILGVIALAKGLRAHAKVLIEYSEDELREIESRL
jgi:hypothetical protein